jgi:5'-nucleotidase
MILSKPIRALVAGATAIATLGGLAASTATHATADPTKPLAGLKVLLTNDDSMRAERPNQSDGLGLWELRKQMCDAGADVVVIAPWSVQSGRGTAVTNSGTIQLGTKPAPVGYENDCGDAPSGAPVVGLCVDTVPCSPTSPGATPSDTVKFGLRGGLAALAGWERPDLLLSGPNSGLNVANSVTDSGTVGAAVAAIEDELPAVAFSTASTNDFSFFPIENYRATAEWGVRFVAGLRAEGLLPQHHFAVSVNYPNIKENGPAKPAVYASVGEGQVARHTYVKQADGSYKIVLVGCQGLPDCVETRKDADAPYVFKDNRITVTPINADRTYGQHIDGAQDLAKLKHFIKHDAPQP